MAQGDGDQMVIINEAEVAKNCIKQVGKLWGTEFWIVNNDSYCMKFLKINPGNVSSFHYHKVKDETFICIAGNVLLTLRDNKQVSLSPGQQYRLQPNVAHSFEALGGTSWVLEVSTTHDDADVFRITESFRREYTR